MVFACGVDWPESLFCKAEVADGTLEDVTKHGAGETVDDRIQSAVEIGESDGQLKALGEQHVGFAVRGVEILDVRCP